MGLPPGPQRPDDPNPFVTGYPSIDGQYHHLHPSSHHPHAPLSSPAYSPNPSYAHHHPSPYHPAYAHQSSNPGYASPSSGHAHPSPAPYPIHQAYGYDPSQCHHYNQYSDPMVPASPYPYQNSAYNNNNGAYYCQPQHNYINPNYPPPVLDPHIDNDSASFTRMMLILLIFLVTAMCMLALVVWFLFGHYIPDFQVTSLSVAKFCTNTSRTLSGNWNATVSIQNDNKDLSVYFEEVVSSVHYEDALLGSSPLNPFQVAPMEQYFLNFTMPEASFDQNFQGPSAAHLALDLSHGVVVFNLRMSMKASFKTPNNKVFKSNLLKLWCPNLQLRFSPSGDGAFEQIMGNSCLISLRASE